MCRCLIACLVIGSFFLNIAVLAQVTSGEISGVVHDASSGVVPGVTITVRNVDTGATRSMINDDEGRYRVTNLSPGTYEVQAELRGFRTVVRKGIELSVGRLATVDIVLEVGELTEEIVVTEDAPIVENQSATIAALVDSKKIRDLPLNKRSFDELVFLQPNVFRVPAADQNQPLTGTTSKIVSGGARLHSNTFLLDGTDVMHMFFGHTPGSVGGTLMGVETIREFKVVTTNFSAELGKSVGAVINAVTKSGTNEFHGTVFEFLRNDNLDARNFFDKEAPEFKRNQFGFTLGGPIVRGRSFFFGSFEALRERLGTTKLAQVPTVQARQGLLQDRRTGEFLNLGVAPEIRPFIALFPLPNSRDFGDGTAEFVSNPVQPTDQDYFQLRVDQQISDSDSFFVRYTFDNASKFVPRELPTHGINLESRNQYLTIEERHIFSPTVLNVFQFGFNRSHTNSFPLTPPFPSGFSINQFSPGGALPGVLGNINIGGLTVLGAGPVDVFRIPDNLFEFQDNLSISKGSHSLKLGGQIKRYQHNWTFNAFFPGGFTYLNLADFLQSRAFTFNGVLEGSTATRHLRETLYAIFLQDDWRLRQNLTFNLGLRYEFVADRTEINNLFVKIIDPNRDAQTTVGLPMFDENPSLANFAPRIGFAWVPFGNSKTAVRGGAGIYYEQLLGNTWGAGTIINPPLVKRVIIRTPKFPDAFQGVQPRIVPALIPFDYFADQPTMVRYSLDIQHEILPDTLFRMGYVGSRGYHLIRRGDINTAFPVPVDGRFFVPLVRPNPNFDSIGIYLTDAESFYNGLELSVNKRFSKGYQFQVSYTLAKSVDDASGDGGSLFTNESAASIVAMRMRELNRGLSAFDMRHNFSLNYTLELPFGPGKLVGSKLTGLAARLAQGWQINGITNINSGVPFTVFVGTDRSNQFSATNTRPDLRPGADNNPVLGGPDRYFDPSAFVLQPQGFIGTLGRNTVIGPGLVNFDLAFVKDTPVQAVSEDFSIQFRAEFFNLFNRANFGLPISRVFNDNTGVPAGNVGRITRTVTTSRQIQFGLKIIF